MTCPPNCRGCTLQEWTQLGPLPGRRSCCRHHLLRSLTSLYTSLHACTLVNELQGTPAGCTSFICGCLYTCIVAQIYTDAYRWTLLCQLTNWFNAYCLVRTYSNSFEALCTVTGVHCWCLSLKQHTVEMTRIQHDGPDHPQKVPKAAEHQPLQPSTGLTSGASKQSGCPFKLGCPSSAVFSDSVRPSVLSHRQAWLLAAAVGVLFRPSSMLFWLALGKPQEHGQLRMINQLG